MEIVSKALTVVLRNNIYDFIFESILYLSSTCKTLQSIIPQVFPFEFNAFDKELFEEIQIQTNIVVVFLEAENINVVKRIIELFGYRKNVTYSDEYLPPLHEAAYFNRIEIAKEILKYEKNINKLGDNGKTAADIASDECNIDILKLLLDNKADTSIGDNHMLFDSVYNYPNDSELIKKIVDNKADVNIPDCDYGNQTPLFYCTMRPNITEYLLAKGANMKHKDDYGKTFADQLLHDFDSQDIEDINVCAPLLSNAYIALRYFPDNAALRTMRNILQRSLEENTENQR